MSNHHSILITATLMANLSMVAQHKTRNFIYIKNV